MGNIAAPQLWKLLNFCRNKLWKLLVLCQSLILPKIRNDKVQIRLKHRIFNLENKYQYVHKYKESTIFLNQVLFLSYSLFFFFLPLNLNFAQES